MKATHSGECQICGAKQMLPNGVLAKHGYTTKWGFFSGVCHGSGYLPFEQSKDQIAGAIAQVEKTISEVSAQCDELENIDSAVNSKPSAMVHLYPRKSACYVWQECAVINFKINPLSGGSVYYSADYVDEEGKARKIESYDKSFALSSVRHFVHHLNCKYAASLRRENSSRRDWVNWQHSRLANWSVKPLTPRA